jgi:signal transduction histidine kinase
LMSGSSETATRIEDAVGELDLVIRDLRNYIFGLRPGILADRQLDQALHVLGEEVQASSQVRIEVEVDAAVAAGLSSRSHTIVQLTREALSNVARHAAATHAVVRLARRGPNAVLTIDDDGVGFDHKSDSAGNGLRNMGERAAAMGGRMRVTGNSGKGTRVRITFPV